MRAATLVVGLALALLSGASFASAATPRASLPDIENEVMCIECGTALFVSQSPVADRERAFIRARIAEGKSKREIKDALVDEYGPAVLATPQDSGFDLSASLVPWLLAGLGLVGVAVAAWRWRQWPDEPPGPATDEATPDSRPPLDADESKRLDADLAAFDRR